MNEVEQMRRAKSELARANSAEQILNSSVFVEAIQIMRADCLGQIEASKQSDDKKRSEIWLQLNAIKELEANLNYIMSNGELAREDITLLERAKKAVGLQTN